MLVLFTGCAQTPGKKTIRHGFEHFQVSIEQDGEVRGSGNSEIVLKKKPFSINVSFVEAKRIFVNASFTDESYAPSKDGSPLSEIPGFTGTGIAEELFNKNEVLFISRDSPNYWYYNSKSDHRFNSVKEESSVLICTRRISAVYDIDGEKRDIEIENMAEKRIFLVFMNLEWNKDYSEKNEKKRIYVKINFQ